MKTQARVVVIGGGIGGCSALYHLTREGWTDVVLVERDELTSGTTWHSAAQCPNLAFNQLLILLRSYTIDLYKTLSQDPDYPINYHHAVGGMRLLTQPDHVDECNHIISVAKGVGVDFELIDAAEAARRNPLLDCDGVIAALWDPLDGDIDPAQLCQALARRARMAGAEIHRLTPVIGLTQKPNHEWIVHTKHGDIHCEHVVNAGGYRLNEVGAMMDITHPVVSMEHMYFITEPIAALAGRDSRVPMVRCPRDRFYMRQEKQGLLVGVYEQDCRTWGMDGIDPNFVNALCPDDLDRCLPDLEPIFDRLPCLKQAGVQSVINGPITYAADAGPLVGRIAGRRNAWLMSGLRVGIGEGGGYGKMLAQMMVHGETDWDAWALDPRRVTGFATTEYAAEKAIEDYRHEFRWHKPHEHRPAGRPAKTSPLYPVLKQQGAAFGVVNGWERVSFFKPGPDFVEEHGYRFANWHETVGEEVRGLTRGVGIAEISGFNRYEISGYGVRDWLNGLTCSRVPRTVGRVGLCYFLTRGGNILSEATLAMMAPDRFWYGSAAAAEDHDMDWLREHLPGDGSIAIESRTNSHTVLVLAGPNVRNLLQSVSPRLNWTPSEFPLLSARACQIGPVQAAALAVSYSGEQAVELHIANTQLHAAYDILRQAGECHGLTPFGAYAIESMRLEMGYGHWKADLISEFNPHEAGLGRFVDPGKDFIGKAGLNAQMAKGIRRRRVLIAIDSDDAPAQPGDSVFSNGNPVGTVTSAAWGYRTQSNIAMAYLDPVYAVAGTRLDVSLLGQTVSAQVQGDRLYDPARHRL